MTNEKQRLEAMRKISLYEGLSKIIVLSQDVRMRLSEDDAELREYLAEVSQKLTSALSEKIK